jgi:nitroreductase
MKFLELAQARQSVREYLQRDVEREKINRCLEAARLAPSACNAQPWSFIVVDDPTLRTRFAQEAFGESFNKFACKAPTFVVVVAERPNIRSQIGGMLKNIPYYLMDIGMAVEHFCLQATEEGLGSCIMGWFNEKAIKKRLKIGMNRRVSLVLAIGYPANEQIRVKNRKSLNEIVQYNPE